MLIHWIWLAHCPNLHDGSKMLLLQHFRDAEEIYFADDQTLRHIPGLGSDALAALENKSLQEAQHILDICSRKKLNILTYQDAAYPAKLKNIYDPPMVLYYKGRLPDLDNNPVIGVVGTRKATIYGLTSAKRLGYQIARCGGIVVSGMASGIDAEAMTGALTAASFTLGVLGCGVDVIYPASNRGLFEDVERYGCIISEFAPGTKPERWNFPRRNRIISGLSNAVLVVEAPEISGALITANQALEQGRDVFVVPGRIDDLGFAGSHRLLRDGGLLVTNGWDILSEYQALYPDKIHQDQTPSRQTAQEQQEEETVSEPENPAGERREEQEISEKKPQADEKNQKKAIDNGAFGTYSELNNLISRLSPEEQAVVAALKNGEQQVDDVIVQTQLTTGKLLSVLTMLEIKGIIRRLPGKRIALR